MENHTNGILTDDQIRRLRADGWKVTITKQSQKKFDPFVLLVFVASGQVLAAVDAGHEGRYEAMASFIVWALTAIYIAFKTRVR